jgi:hypothetical protein
VKLFSQFHGLFKGIFDGDYFTIYIQFLFKSGIGFFRDDNITIIFDFLDAILYLSCQIDRPGLFKGHSFRQDHFSSLPAQLHWITTFQSLGARGVSDLPCVIKHGHDIFQGRTRHHKLIPINRIFSLSLTIFPPF